MPGRGRTVGCGYAALGSMQAKGDAKERCGDTECRENRSFESAGNFGDATAASAMIHRDFQDAGPLLCHQHLHLQIPAVSLLPHLFSNRVCALSTSKRGVQKTEEKPETGIERGRPPIDR